MSIKEEFEKNQKNQKKSQEKLLNDIGNGIIKIEIKDGHIEASTKLNIPNKTLAMVLIMLEVLQRSMVEDDEKVKGILKNLRKISDKELMQLVEENSQIMEVERNASNTD